MLALQHGVAPGRLLRLPPLPRRLTLLLAHRSSSGGGAVTVKISGDGSITALRIDPASKRLVFSDSLNIPRALELYRHFKGRIQTGFGIGTDLSNDTPHEALNIVMKITACNGQPVAKLSDEPGKTLCDDQTFLAYLRQVFSH